MLCAITGLCRITRVGNLKQVLAIFDILYLFMSWQHDSFYNILTKQNFSIILILFMIFLMRKLSYLGP